MADDDLKIAYQLQLQELEELEQTLKNRIESNVRLGLSSMHTRQHLQRVRQEIQPIRDALAKLEETTHQRIDDNDNEAYPSIPVNNEYNGKRSAAEMMEIDGKDNETSRQDTNINNNDDDDVIITNEKPINKAVKTADPFESNKLYLESDKTNLAELNKFGERLSGQSTSSSSQSTVSNRYAKITLAVRGGKKSIKYRSHISMTFEKMMRHYCESVGVFLTDIRFMYRGKVLSLNQTPFDFAMTTPAATYYIDVETENSPPTRENHDHFTSRINEVMPKRPVSREKSSIEIMEINIPTQKNESDEKMVLSHRKVEPVTVEEFFSMERPSSSVSAPPKSAPILPVLDKRAQLLLQEDKAKDNLLSTPNDKIIIKVVRPMSATVKSVKFAIRKSDTFRKLFEKYCMMMKLSDSDVKFFYSNIELSPNEIIGTLGLIDRSIIDAFTTAEFLRMNEGKAGSSRTSDDNLGLPEEIWRKIASAKSILPYAGATSSSTLPNTNSNAVGELDMDDWNETEVHKKIEKLLESFNVEIPLGERISNPQNLAAELKEYQRIGVTWMTRMENSNNRGGILSDEMGLGKTVQTIATILANPPIPRSDSTVGRRKYERKGTLIVLPLSLMDQWYEELRSLINPEADYNILQYHGDFLSKSKKREIEENPRSLYQYDIVLTTYNCVSGMFPFDKNRKRQYTMNTFEFDRDDEGVGPFFRYNWYRCVLDEAHIIKNRQSRGSIACSYLDAEYKWCLTGTPIQNTSDDLYSLLRFLGIEPYCSWNRFQSDLSVNPSKSGSSSGLSREDRLKKLQAVLQCCLLRRTKNSKIDGSDEPIVKLPEKIILNDRPEMSPEERQVYDDFEKKNVEKFEKIMHEYTRHFRSILTMIMRMRQMCLHPYLVFGQSDLLEQLGVSVVQMEKIIDNMDSTILKRLEEIVVSDNISDCAICLDPPTNPVATLCGHIYCGECIINVCQAAEEPVCPSCRTTISKQKLIPMAELEKKFGVAAPEESSPDTQIIEDQGSSSSTKKPRKARKNKTTDDEDYIPDGNDNDDYDDDEDDFGSMEMTLDGRKFTPSTKINRLMEILENTRREFPNEKTIVFCSFTKMLDLCQIPLRCRGFKFVRIDGTMSISERSASVSRFSKHPKFNIMLASLRCGSVGLNLVAANRVILLDCWWNPALENQAIDRVHRIGQLAKSVHVVKITIPNTIEDRILDLQQRKQELTNEALGEGQASGGQVKRLTRSELIYLFRGNKRPAPQQFGTNIHI